MSLFWKLAVAVIISAVICLVLTSSTLALNVRNYQNDHTPQRRPPPVTADDEYSSQYPHCVGILGRDTICTELTFPRYSGGNVVTEHIPFGVPFSSPPPNVTARLFDPQLNVEPVYVDARGVCLQVTVMTELPLFKLDRGVCILPSGDNRTLSSLIDIPSRGGLVYVYRDANQARFAHCRTDDSPGSGRLLYDSEQDFVLPGVAAAISNPTKRVLCAQAFPLDDDELALVYVFDVADSDGLALYLRLGTLTATGTSTLYTIWNCGGTSATADPKVKMVRDPATHIIYIMYCTDNEWRIAALRPDTPPEATLQSVAVGVIFQPTSCQTFDMAWVTDRLWLLYGGGGTVSLTISTDPINSAFSSPTKPFGSARVDSHLALVTGFADVPAAIGFRTDSAAVIAVLLSPFGGYPTRTIIAKFDREVMQMWALSCSWVIAANRLCVGGLSVDGISFSMVAWNDRTFTEQPRLVLTDSKVASGVRTTNSTAFLAKGSQLGQEVFLITGDASMEVATGGVAYAVNVGVVTMPVILTATVQS